MWDTWTRTATVSKPKGKRNLARTRRSREKDKKWVLKMDSSGSGRDKWQALLKATVNF
jgi:hypothetical protein